MTIALAAVGFKNGEITYNKALKSNIILNNSYFENNLARL